MWGREVIQAILFLLDKYISAWWIINKTEIYNMQSGLKCYTDTAIS